MKSGAALPLREVKSMSCNGSRSLTNIITGTTDCETRWLHSAGRVPAYTQQSLVSVLAYKTTEPRVMAGAGRKMLGTAPGCSLTYIDTLLCCREQPHLALC